MDSNSSRNFDIPTDERKRAEYFFNNLKLYTKNELNLELNDEEVLAFASRKVLKYEDAIWKLFQKYYNLEKVTIENYSLVNIASSKGIKPNVYFQYEKVLVDNLIEILNRNFELIHKINPSDFEFVIARLLEKYNYKVEVTNQTKDNGFDIIALSGDRFPIKHLVECKRYTNKIGINLIRSFMYVIDKQNANQGVIFTTSSYTKDAKKEAAGFGNKIQLIDSEELKNWIQQNLESEDDLPF